MASAGVFLCDNTHLHCQISIILCSFVCSGAASSSSPCCKCTALHAARTTKHCLQPTLYFDGSPSLPLFCVCLGRNVLDADWTKPDRNPTLKGGHGWRPTHLPPKSRPGQTLRQSVPGRYPISRSLNGLAPRLRVFVMHRPAHHSTASSIHFIESCHWQQHTHTFTTTTTMTETNTKLISRQRLV